MAYEQVYDGDWVRPIMNGYRMRCCDCGLVHELNFKVTRDRKVMFQVFRNNRATAAFRRRMAGRLAS